MRHHLLISAQPGRRDWREFLNIKYIYTYTHAVRSRRAALRCDGHLFKRDAPGQQLDQIPGLDDGIRVECLLRSTNWDAALNQVQGGFDVLAKVRGGTTSQRRKRLRSVRPFQTDVLLLLKLSPPAASTPSGRLLCIWGRGWRSCFPPAGHEGCHLEWTGAPSSHQGQSGGQTRPLWVQAIIWINTSINTNPNIVIPSRCGSRCYVFCSCVLAAGRYHNVHTTNFIFLLSYFWNVLQWSTSIFIKIWGHFKSKI